MMGDWPKRARVTCLVLAGLLVLALAALAWTHARHRERNWMTERSGTVRVLDMWTGDVYQVSLYDSTPNHQARHWDRSSGRHYLVTGGKWQRR